MEENTHISSIYAGGLIAIGLIILQGFLSLSTLDVAAFIAVFAFAFSIPILSCNIIINFARRGTTIEPSKYEVLLFYVPGAVVSLIGIVATFWHICWVAAVIFSVSMVLAFFVYFNVQKH